MAVNYNDPQQVESFKKTALSQGIAPEKVAAFIAQKQTAAAPQTPAPTSSEPSQTHIQDGSVTGFIKNVIGSGVRTIGDIGSALVNTVNPDLSKNTVANAARLGLGTIELAIPGEQGHEAYPRAVGTFYKNRYGSLQAIGDTLYNDPVGALLDASMVADLGGSAIAKVGEVGKIAKLAEAGKAIARVGEAIDPLRLATKGVGKVLNPKLADTSEVVGKVGSDVRQGVSKIYLEPSIYGAEREKIVAKVLDKHGAVGSAQAKYEKLQPIMEDLANQIDVKLAENPVPITKDLVNTAFKEKVASTIRTSDLELPQAQKMVDKYISDLSELPVDSMTTQDLFSLKKVINNDATRIYDKLSRQIPLTPKEEVILAFRNAVDDVIAVRNPEVKALTLEQSALFDAVDSLNRSRKTNPTTRIAGTTVPAGVMQTAQDLTGAGIQKVGKAIGAGEVPTIGMTPLTKSLSVLPRSEQLQNDSYDTQGQVEQNTTNNEINSNHNLPSNPADVTLGSSNSIAQTPGMADLSGSKQSTLNSFGATPEQIWNAYIKTSQMGNKKKATLLKEMFNEEIKYQQRKAKDKKAGSGLGTAIDEMERLYGVGTKSTISAGDSTVGVKGLYARAGVKTKMLTDQEYVDRVTQYNQMRALAVGIINKARQAGTLNSGEYEIMVQNMPNEYSSETVAKKWFSNVKKLLPIIEAQQQLPANPADVQFDQ